MQNPWLNIPASDYESHMALPDVAQAQALAGLMADALEEHTPASLAVVGCATGNGFEHINATSTRRVVGVDLNPAYLSVLEERFGGKLPGLELIEADIAAPEFRLDPVSMVVAGLLFEYVDVSAALCNISKSMTAGAILLAVLQLPSPESAPVTQTPYKSLGQLAPFMNLVPPSEFSAKCAEAGFQAIRSMEIPLKKGKAFFVGFYRKKQRIEND